MTKPAGKAAGKPFGKGKTYKLKLATQEVECHIESIEKVLDASNLETIAAKDQAQSVRRHEVAELTIHTRKPIAFDVHAEIAPSHEAFDPTACTRCTS